VTLKLPTGPALMRARDFSHVDTLMRRWAPNWTGPDRDETADEVKQAFADPRVLDGALAYYRDIDRSGLPNLPQPALIVGGTTDILPPEPIERSAEAFDGPCETMIADGAGHWPHREAADAFHERLVAFLRGPAAQAA
jgi:pimeloyl-ACP methyl ester carboxylesterase